MSIREKYEMLRLKARVIQDKIEDLRLDPNLFTNASDNLIQYLSDKNLALSHDFDVRVLNEQAGVDETIISCETITMPTFGISFKSESELETFITPQLEEYMPVTMTFWDTDDLRTFDLFMRLYQFQLHPRYKTFKINYKTTTIIITIVGLVSYKLTGVAIQHPMHDGLDQTDVGLLKGTVVFTYKDLEITVL